MKLNLESALLGKTFLSLLIIVFAFNFGIAQKLEYGFPSQAWHSGSLTLNDGTIIEGKIKYDLESDMLHLNVGGNTRTYVASQIEKFSVFQRDIKRQRDFVSIPFETKSGYKRPKLFELVYQNNISLFVREVNSYSNQTRVNPLATNGVGRLHAVRVGVVNYKYYLANDKGSLKPVDKGVKGVSRSFDNYQREIRSFIRSNKLKVKEIEDMVKVVSYYNTLG